MPKVRTDENGLTDRQREAMAVVLASPTLKAGLDAADLHRATWHRWMQQPEFKSAADGLRKQALDEALSDLRQGTRFAVSAMLGLLASKNENIRLSAARSVLEFAQRGIETEELQARLARIEEAVLSVRTGEAP